jgi:2OG-Fe(II) oxygenase superfamily
MDFQQITEDVTKLVNDINGDSKYYSTGNKSFIIPGLYIKEIGEIPFPLTEVVAKEIIKQAKQAPFGKGTKTIVDTNIRNTWEVDAHLVEIKSPKWNKILADIVQTVKGDLGIYDVAVKAELYKLLVYEKGSFFAKHQDTEREKGMFATLVIVLPSVYEGGEFEIYFDGKKETIDLSKEPYDINFVSFYADCEHAIFPVKKGYRIALVYNLIKTSGSANPKPFVSSTHVNKLYNYFSDIKPPVFQKPLSIVLEHQYTPENFSWQNLKGNDLAMVEIVKTVAEKLGWYYNIGLLTHHVIGEPEESGYGYYNEDIDAETATMGEVIDESTSIDNWCNMEYPSLTGIQEGLFQMINAKDYSNEEPYERQAEGYMGNYGPEIEFWYHNALLVISPFKTILPILYQGNNYCKIEWIKYFLDTMPANTANAIHLLHAIDVKELRNDNINPDALLEMFEKKVIDFSADKLYANIVAYYFESFSVNKLLFFLNLLTLNEIKSLALATYTDIKAPVYIKWIKVWATIYKKKDEQLIQKIKIIEDELIALLPAQINANVHDWESPHSDTANSNIISEFIELGDFYNQKTESVVKTFRQLLKREMIYKNFKSIFEKITSSNDLLKGLIHLVVNLLQELTSQQPYREPSWKRFYPDQKPVNEFQKLLYQFCNDASAKVFEYRAAQNMRSQVENYIANYKLDISCNTIKKGTPHTLVLTKNENAYNKKMNEYYEDVKYLDVLKKMI